MVSVAQVKHSRGGGRGVPVLQQHEAALEGAPPQLLLHTDLHSWGVHGEGEQYHAGGNGPVVVVDPPGPDAAPIHLNSVTPHSIE